MREGSPLATKSAGRDRRSRLAERAAGRVRGAKNVGTASRLARVWLYMSNTDAFLREFDDEMASTRRLLERVPADKLGWKPHGKSKSLGELATHVTELARWGIRAQKDSFQVGSEAAPPLKTAADYLARFDGNVAESRESIARMPEDKMKDEFTVLKPNGDVFFKVSRQGVLRSVLLNHMIHHRGQLTVYFRENDVPLPPIYGPTADESI